MAPDSLRARARSTGPSLAFHTIGVKGYYNSIQPPPLRNSWIRPCISICNEAISTAILLSNRSKHFLSLIIVQPPHLLICILCFLTILCFLLELSLPLPCLIRFSNPDSRFTVRDENVLRDDPAEVDSLSRWSLSPLSVEDILSDAIGLDHLNSSRTICLISIAP